MNEFVDGDVNPNVEVLLKIIVLLVGVTLSLIIFSDFLSRWYSYPYNYILSVVFFYIIFTVIIYTKNRIRRR